MRSAIETLRDEARSDPHLRNLLPRLDAFDAQQGVMTYGQPLLRPNETARSLGLALRNQDRGLEPLLLGSGY